MPCTQVFAVIEEDGWEQGCSVIIRDKDATFARLQHLVKIETENTDIADRAGKLTMPRSADRLRVVLDDLELVLFGNLEQLREIGRLTEEVHGHDCLRIFR